jgi:hypothetical protein
MGKAKDYPQQKKLASCLILAIFSGWRPLRSPSLTIHPTAVSRKRLKAVNTRTSPSSFYCAFVQVSDPVSLTDTPEKKIRSGLPSAVPRWSVEIRIGPAFL